MSKKHVMQTPVRSRSLSSEHRLPAPRRGRTAAAALIAAALVPILWIWACQSDVPAPESSQGSQAERHVAQPERSPEVPPSSVQVTPPVDLDGLMRRVHFAFAPKGNSFVGGHFTHTLRVNPRGELAFAPVHHRGASETILRGRPLRIQTATITFGDKRLTEEAEVGIDSEDGSLLVERGAVTERLENGPLGVEQSWRLASRPSGAGGLTVRVDVQGLEQVAVTEQGIHFRDSTSGLGVRYGHATWIDASGERHAVQGQLSGNQVSFHVPEVVVQASKFPAVLDPLIAAEVEVNQPAHGPQFEDQQGPAVAFDGTNYLVVWEDNRGTDQDILAARISTAGEVVDPMGLLVCGEEGDQGAPTVAFDGTNYLVVWQDRRDGAEDIYAGRLSAADGSLLDGTGIAVSAADREQQAPAVAFDGTNYLVVWQDRRNNAWDIYGARVSPQGNVVTQDQQGLAISTASRDQQAPAVAFDGTNYLVVWQDDRSVSDWNIYAARVSPAAAVLDSSGIPVAAVTNDQRAPAVAFDGTNYLVVWQDDRNPSTKFDIYGARLTPAGSFVNPSLDPLGIAISKQDDDVYDQAAPAVAFDGTNYFVAWEDNRAEVNGQRQWDLNGAQVTPDGAVVTRGSGTTAISLSTAPGHQQQAAVVFGGGRFLVAWADFRTLTGYTTSSGRDIFGVQVDTSGALVGSARPLSVDLTPQERPDVAFDGTNYLVVWSDFRMGSTAPGWDIYGARISATGSVLDPTGIAISAADDDQRHPSVAYDGTNYLVVWQDHRNDAPGANTRCDIYGARVSKAGAVLNATGLAIYSGDYDQQDPSVAFDGTNYLVVWWDQRTNNQRDIYGARVAPVGTVVDATGFAISTAPNHQQSPEVAYDGSNYLLVWQDLRGGSDWDIYGARVSPAAAVLDPGGVVVTFSSNDQMAPALVFGDGQYLVVWQDYRTGGGWDIYGARVSTAAVNQDPLGLALSTAADDQQAPAVAFDGTSFLAAWQDFRGGSSWDIYAARLTPDGQVVDHQGIALSEADHQEGAPALGSGGAGSVALVYVAMDGSSPFGVERLRARRVITRQPLGTACTIDLDCQSDHCADEVCCDTACGGSVSEDCQACSVAAGASANGTCGPLQAGAVCRGAGGDCDVEEICDGISLSCPQDELQAAGFECREAAGLCDAPEVCDGISASCPTDSLRGSGTACREAAGECDVAEVCSGQEATCPADEVAADDTACAGGTCQGGACVPLPDAGLVSDAQGPWEAGADLSTHEAGADLSPHDAGPADLAVNDAAASDSAPAADSRPLDQALVDAGRTDAGPASDQGTVTDAGGADMTVTEAGPTADQGVEPDLEPFWDWNPDRAEGCSCQTGPTDGSNAIPLMALGLILLCTRRRRRQRHRS